MNAKVASDSPNGAWVPIAMGVLFLVWLALFAAGVTTKAVEFARPFLPSWFPLLNLALVPVLTFLTAAPLAIPATARLACATLALCSLSAMFLAYRAHPVAYFSVLMFFLVEVFVLVPWWERARRRMLGSPPLVPRVGKQKSSARDYVIYLIVGLAVAACLLYFVFARQ